MFETFLFQKALQGPERVGRKYGEGRANVMLERNEGLTQTYNLLHDHDETSSDIQKLRELHVEIDQAVAAAYGWSDLVLGHDFHETKQGVRFTISEPARREVLQRLLKVTHERYAEEEKQGLHGKKAALRKKAAPRKRVAGAPVNEESALFDMEGDE